jgi:hypothetical protein
MPYKNQEQAKEAARIRQQKHRAVTPTNFVTPSMSHPETKAEKGVTLDPKKVLPDELYKTIVTLSRNLGEPLEPMIIDGQAVNSLRDRLYRAASYHLWNEERLRERKVCVNVPEPMPV